MKYAEAYEKFSKAYVDRNKVEFPAILKLCNFRNKTVLEIGAGHQGLFPKKVAGRTKKYVATDISASVLKKLRKNIEVETKVCKGEKIPFPDILFDIVFARWTHFNNFQKAIKEMCRVSKCCVLIVLPSEQGDQTKLMQIKYKNKYKYRKERIKKIKKRMRQKGFRVMENKKLLRFAFPPNQAAEILTAVDFENKLNNKQKQKLGKFLLRRKKKGKIIFTQGASFICGCKC